NMGRVRQHPKEAAEDLSAILAEDPGMMVVHRYRAIALQQTGDEAGAAEELGFLERDGSATTSDLAMRGECLRRAGKGEESVAVPDRAIGKDPPAAEPLLALGRTLIVLGRFGEAEAAFNKMLALVPGAIEALRGQADLADAKGDFAGAARGYREI